ncbi:MAG: histone deacetylase [Elusimicrobia bacterium]|nr:histone deacetylase [Elusimicrobiota bacterium]
MSSKPPPVPSGGSAPILFSARYEVDIGTHVFPTAKYRLVKEFLIQKGWAKAKDFQEPPPASIEELLLAHTEDWVHKVLQGKMTALDEARLELPCSKALAEASQRAAGGTLQACRLALQTGVGLHDGGGFHHAFPDHGEGFCVFHDIAVGILKMKQEGKIRRAAVVDLDVHHGNGTAAIFAQDPKVFTFSMHQQSNYPLQKPPSDLDVGLADGTSDAQYLKLLKQHWPKILDSHRPELVLYQAGADSYGQDQLGGLGLTLEGMQARDATVIEETRRRKIPLVITLGGGYAHNLQDTVLIHATTLHLGLKSQ